MPRRRNRWANGHGVDLLKLFRDKTALWGRYLLASFLTTGSLSASAMSDMAMESLDIRKCHAWSVPTPEALDVIAVCFTSVAAHCVHLTVAAGTHHSLQRALRRM